RGAHPLPRPADDLLDDHRSPLHGRGGAGAAKPVGSQWAGTVVCDRGTGIRRRHRRHAGGYWLRAALHPAAPARLRRLEVAADFDAACLAPPDVILIGPAV